MALFLGFMSGVFLASFFKVSFWAVWLFGGAGVVVMVIGRVCKGRQSSVCRRLVWIGVFILAFSFGILRFEWHVIHQEDAFLKTFSGKHVSGRGIVAEEPDRRDNALRLTLSIISIDGSDQKKFRNNILLVAGAYNSSRYGDEVSFSGMLIPPANFKTDSGRTFDYVHYLEKDNIYFLIQKPSLSFISSGHGDWLKTYLLRFKYYFLERLALVVPEPELSLLGGLLLGTKQSLGKTLLAEFQKAGVIHMVVISGYNITIVAQAIDIFLSFMSLSFRICFSAFGIILFLLMTGLSGASVRAAIMAVLALAARFLGRKYNVTKAFLFAAFAMVFYNPLSLSFDPSFQLSFLATLALLVVSPLVEPYSFFLPPFFGIRETFVATFSTQLFLLPFLLYLTGIFSAVSLPVNLLVLFPVPFTMLFGLITGALACVGSMIALPSAFATQVLLAYILFIVEKAANLRFAAFPVSAFPFWLTALIYIFHTLILWKLHKRKRMLIEENPLLKQIASRQPPN
jgi:competence protein ComEC